MRNLYEPPKTAVADLLVEKQKLVANNAFSFSVVAHSAYFVALFILIFIGFNDGFLKGLQFTARNVFEFLSTLLGPGIFSFVLCAASIAFVNMSFEVLFYRISNILHLLSGIALLVAISYRKLYPLLM